MYKIELIRENRRFVIDSYGKARLIDISGIGVPPKDVTTMVFAGQSGQSITSLRDTERTITMSFDFWASPREIKELLNLIYGYTSLVFHTVLGVFCITGQCRNSTDFERIIYHRWNKIVLQFVCDNPYFEDINKTVYPIASHIDKFPNLFEDGVAKISLPAVATEGFAKASVINRGAVRVYPTIRVTNTSSVTAKSITVANHTTGAQIVINCNISPNATVVFDLENRRVLCRDADITHCIADGTSLGAMYLEVGDNELEVTAHDESIFLASEAVFANRHIAVVI